VAELTAKRRGRFSGWVLASLAFSLLALISLYTLDIPTVRYVHDHHIDTLTKFWIRLRKLKFDWPGHFLCTLIIAALIALFHQTGLRGAVTLLLAGIFTGANSLIKWIVGRNRPISQTGTASFTLHPFSGGIYGLFHQINLAFPSGDVALAVSFAATLSYLLPRYRLFWWLLAIIVAAQRIAENAHHLSDVLAAAALGIVAFHCAKVLCKLSPDKAQGRAAD
jgi:membrane-associated phospholipid phosphatase